MNSIDWERDKPYESPEDTARRHEARGYCKGYFTMCSDCPPENYPTDKTRCIECPRRAVNSGSESMSEYADLSKLRPTVDPDEHGMWTCSACGWHGHESRIVRRVARTDQDSDTYCPNCDRPVVVIQRGYRSWEKRS